MTREVPTSKQTTIWFGSGRWFRSRGAAYYAIARALMVQRYPRWLDDPNLEDASHEDGQTIGDVYAAVEVPPMCDWRARRDRRHRLFVRCIGGGYEGESYEGFDTERWKRHVGRLARFLAFVDRRREELHRG